MIASEKQNTHQLLVGVSFVWLQARTGSRPTVESNMMDWEVNLKAFQSHTGGQEKFPSSKRAVMTRA